MTHVATHVGRTVLGQRVEAVKIVCCPGMWTTPALLSCPAPPSHRLQCGPEWHPSPPSMSGGIHVSQPPAPCYHCSLGGSWKRGMWSGKWGFGEITLPQGPLHSAYVSGGCRRWARRVHVLSGCLREVISLHRTHEVLISVCIKQGGQISGEENRCQREVGGDCKWPTSSHHQTLTVGCTQSGPFGKSCAFSLLWVWGHILALLLATFD